MTPSTILRCFPSFGLSPLSIGPRNWTTQIRAKFNPPNDSCHHITVFPKFWTQSDIDWSLKSDNSSSNKVRSEMEWLVYCTGLGIGFH
ncbi:unnamed protein product [Prunus armeniaca]